jgi:nucleotide-binding universal stress UspA family protein
MVREAASRPCEWPSTRRPADGWGSSCSITLIDARIDQSAAEGWSDPDWDRAVSHARQIIGAGVRALGGRSAAVPIDHAFAYDSPARSLVEAVRRAQLLVVGSRGRGGFSGMRLGTTAAALSAGASCPVVVVRRSRALWRTALWAS